MFSIIIPIYNVEKYLERCIKSIINQTYKDFEAIFINDGSTDSSITVLKKYSALDERIIVIDKENEGVSSARNLGLEKAHGKFVVFVDADDYIDNHMLETLSKAPKDSDLIMFNYIDNGVENLIKTEVPNRCTATDALILVSGMDSFRGFVWNKAFKKSIIEKNNLRFQNNIHMCEDLCFCVDFIEKSTNIQFIDKPLYFYEHCKAGVSANVFNQKRASVITAYDYLLGKPIIFENKSVNKKYRYQYIRHCLSLWNMTKNKEEFKTYNKEMVERIKKEDWSFVMNSEFKIKFRIIFTAIKLFG